MKRAILFISALLTLASPGLTQGQKEERDLLRWMRQENPPVIREIRIEGNRYFTEGRLRKQMYSKKRSFWSALKGDRRTRLQRESLGRDTLELKYLYFREGFLGIRIQEHFEPIGRDSAAAVIVSVSEGRQFRFGVSTVEGDHDPRFIGGLERIARRLRPGQPMDPFILRDAVFSMKELLANDGYPYAQIDYHLDTAATNPSGNVRFQIRSGQPTTFGAVRVIGLKEFPSYVAHRELKIQQEATYRRRDILDSQQRLYESGYFNTLTLAPDTLVDSLRPDFALRVRERKPMYTTFLTGAKQSEVRDLLWESSIEIGKRNFIGSRKIDVRAAYGFVVGTEHRLIDHEYRLRFTEPWFLGIRMPLALAGTWRPRLQSATQEYDITSWAVSASTTRKFGQEITAGSGIEYESITISNIPVTPLVAAPEQSGRRKLFFDFRRDSRQNLFLPDRGSRFDLSLEYYGGFLGGDASFAKVRAAYSSYQVIWPGWTSATRLLGGWADAFSDTLPVPSEDRFSIGGANTVRGVTENSLGVEGGSNVMAIVNQEFRWRTIQVLHVVPLLGDLMRPFPLWQSLFFDMGNGANSWPELRLRDLAMSYGTGVQLVTPAGPIRVDYARLIKTRRYPVEDQWHFTILYAF